jgi:hypothetical protein
MAPCEIYSNPYEESFEVSLGGESQIFDSFECAFYTVAPLCAYCGCRVSQHGIEAGGLFFCRSACAHEYGSAGSAAKTTPVQIIEAGAEYAHV